MSSTPATGSFVVSESLAGSTLAAAVRELLGGLSWSAAKALCAAGRVRVDGQTARDPAQRLTAGANLSVGAEGQREERSLLVHVDEAIAVVDKPPGLLTTPVEARDRDTLIQRAAAAVRKQDAHRGRRGSPSLRAVQRLDRDTSGLLVFARTVLAQRGLQDQLKGRTVLRLYLALVHGRANDATYETHLLEDRGDGIRGSWERLRKPGPPPVLARTAITHVQVMRRFADATLVACRLETGRQHQIRIHLSEAGHPLLGEPVYVRGSRLAAARDRAPRVMLHAAELGFTPPITGQQLAFAVEPPPDFAAVVRSLAD